MGLMAAVDERARDMIQRHGWTEARQRAAEETDRLRGRPMNRLAHEDWRRILGRIDMLRPPEEGGGVLRYQLPDRGPDRIGAQDH
jgi:hypothetical protein